MIATPIHIALAQSLEDLQHLSIEDLANIEISSVSKKAEPLSDAAAAVYVITHDDVLRSGATSLPEILRLAPNLQVAQVTAHSYAISARGFNATSSDKLLVLIDGRSVYSPYYSGVAWDVQDVPPENIDRIEVISGPGATLWGANAVNGVINIITRKSAETQGAMLQLGAGNLEARASAQFGGKIGEDLAYRLYAQGFGRANDVLVAGTNAHDSWNKPQGGFRVDWSPAGDLVTLQGDFYKGSEERLSGPNESLSGKNLLARWNRQFDGGSALQVQAYYDYSAHSIVTIGGDFLRTYDLDVQHSFSLGTWQDIVWGGGYRSMHDNFPTVPTNVPNQFFAPQSRTLGLTNGFVQDSISLGAAVKLIVGLKLEDDPYSGLKPLPSVRLSWKVTDSDLLWGAVSRAIRAPSRLDRDFFEALGSFTFLAGGNFQSEKVNAYEVGYRAQPTTNLMVSISTFYNVYQDLRTLEYAPGNNYPVSFGNDMEGDTYGVEFSSSYKLYDWWRLSGGMDWLRKNLHLKPGSSGLLGIASAGNDPAYRFTLRSSMNLTDDIALDLDLRGVGALPNPVTPSYVEFNAHIAWAVTKAIEVSLTGSNLLHPHHVEFGATASTLQLGPTAAEVSRSFFVNTRWRF